MNFHGAWIMHSTHFMFSFVCIHFSQTSAAPNLIFILADDLGWDDVGFHGSEIKTPNIDRLAKEGVILDNYYVQPICTPTRGSILTGRYPIHTGLQHYVIVGSQPYGMPLNVTTLPQELKNIGYKTHAVGKWHLGFCSDAYLPQNRGFDSFLGYYTGHSDYFDHYTHDGTYMGYDLHKNKSTLWNETEMYSTELFTAQAKSIIQSHDKSSPLFMYIAHQAVHAGNFDVLQAPQKYIDRFDYITDLKRKLFAGMVSALDDSVGDIYQSLVDVGLADNTVIVFSTDNGGPTNGYDGNAACNWPLRGCKNTLWQGGVRGVGFVHSPLLKMKGYVNQNLMHVTDWLPTLLSLAANHSNEMVPTTNLQHSTEDLDGFDQWNVITLNAETKRKEVLLNIDPVDKHEAIIVGDFKLIHGPQGGWRYSGWYPPPPHKTNSFEPLESEFEAQDCHGLACHGRRKELSSQDIFDIEKLLKNNIHIDKIVSFINKEYKKFKQDVGIFSESEKSNQPPLLFSPEKDLETSGLMKEKSASHSRGDVTVNCGPKPANASINCNPVKEACLYNIREDPCEYVNLAHSLPSIQIVLQSRLQMYRRSMVPPANKPIDPRGNPQLNGGVWKPWL